MKNKYFIAYRDATIAALIVFLISITTGYVVYSSAEKGLKLEVIDYLGNISKTAANFLDVELHNQVTKPEDKYGEVYEAARAPFYNILKANPNLAFIYTAIKKPDDKIYFILDSKILKEGEEDDTSGVMEEYPDFTPKMIESFETQKPLVDSEPYTDEYGTFLSGYTPFFDKNGTFVGIVGVDIKLNDYQTELAKVKKSLIIGSIIAFIASLLVGFAVFLAKKSSINSELKAIEQQNKVAEFEAKQIEQQKIAEERAKIENQRQRAALAENFNRSVKNVVNIISASSTELGATANNISEMAQTSAQKTNDVANKITTSTQSMNQVSSNAETLLEGIEKIYSEVNQSVTIAGSAQQESVVVREKSAQLNVAAENISSIAELIDSISEQINLLALNATIEAARAGDAGKGFAVVASEVKSLANQANEATAKINKYLDAIKNVASETTDAISNMAAVINNLTLSSQRVIDVTISQKDAVSKITSELINTTALSNSTTKEIQAVADFANKSGQSTEEILIAIKDLSNEAVKLNNEINNFMSELLKDNN